MNQGKVQKEISMKDLLIYKKVVVPLVPETNWRKLYPREVAIESWSQKMVRMPGISGKKLYYIDLKLEDRFLKWIVERAQVAQSYQIEEISNHIEMSEMIFSDKKGEKAETSLNSKNELVLDETLIISSAQINQNSIQFWFEGYAFSNGNQFRWMSQRVLMIALFDEEKQIELKDIIQNRFHYIYEKLGEGR